MFERRRAANPLVSLLLFTALSFSAIACSDGGSGGGGGGQGGGGGAGGSSTTTTTTSGGGPVILSCGQNLAFVASCRVEDANYTACSDFFGNNDPKAVENQCIAGNGTFSTTPCELDNRAGACVFYNDALPDRCYVEHIAPPSAAGFWETTCPQVGGSWKPAE